MPGDQAKPAFDLVHPGCVFGCIDKADPVGRVCQKFHATLLRLQNTILTLDTQIISDVALSGNKTHKAF